MKLVVENFNEENTGHAEVIGILLDYGVSFQIVTDDGQVEKDQSDFWESSDWESSSIGC